MKTNLFADRLKVHIDFPGATKFRLTTPYRQREFEVSKCGRYINAETLEPIKTNSKPDFWLEIVDIHGYIFKAGITDNGGIVGQTSHLKPLTVDFKMVRKK